MKIAVTYENGRVFQHFGHTQQFKVYETQDGAILQSEIISASGRGHGALAGLLAEQNINVLLCGGIGAGAQTALAQAGIQLYGGVTGDADAAVQAFLAGNLSYDPDVHCDHHDHHDHHDHGEGCGEDKHGCPGSGTCGSGA